MRHGTLAGVAAGAPFVLAPAAAQAIEVTNANPSGAGSLANAVFAVNSSPTEDTITFASSLSGQTITTAGQLYFDADEISIIGPGADKLTISGNNTHRVFGFNPDNMHDDAEVRGLTLTRGNAGSNSGGAIANVDAELLLVDVAVSGNTARQGGGLFSGFQAVNRIERSTISGNTATAAGGGGIYSDGDLGSIRSSTIAGNVAGFGGGVSSNGALSIYDSTIAGNATRTNGKGAGVYNESGDETFHLFSTIVANNASADGVARDLSNEFQASASLIESTQNATLTQGPGGINIVGSDPQLRGLAPSGGSTATMLPAATSPAVDKGRLGGPATDQRGLPRPFDFPAIADGAAGGADIGAVELQASDLAKKKCKKKPKKKGKGKTAVPAAKKKKKGCKKKRKKGKK